MHEHLTAPAVDFWAVFESAPDVYLLLSPDPPRFTMIAANEARLRATATRRDDVIGRPLFEVFPDHPTDPQASGVRNLRPSLIEVIRTGKPAAWSCGNTTSAGPMAASKNDTGIR